MVRLEQPNFAPALFMQGEAPSEPGSACDWDGATHVFFDECESAKEVAVVETCREQEQARVLDVSVTLRNVCPGRAGTLGLSLNELDENGAEHARGFRAISVPPQPGSRPQDVQLGSVRFVLPGDTGLQRRRHLVVRTTHHYLDSSAE